VCYGSCDLVGEHEVVVVMEVIIIRLVSAWVARLCSYHRPKIFIHNSISYRNNNMIYSIIQGITPQIL
jgi:hypothetical protein